MDIYQTIYLAAKIFSVIFDRPCVAGAVLQTALLIIDYLTDGLWKYISHGIYMDAQNFHGDTEFAKTHRICMDAQNLHGHKEFAW